MATDDELKRSPGGLIRYGAYGAPARVNPPSTAMVDNTVSFPTPGMKAIGRSAVDAYDRVTSMGGGGAIASYFGGGAPAAPMAETDVQRGGGNVPAVGGASMAAPAPATIEGRFGAGAGRGFVNPAVVNPMAAPPKMPFDPSGGTDVGFGTRKILGGSSPLFTNVADNGDNAALMARGAPSAQNLGALEALAGRQEAESVGRVRAGMAKEQYDAEVAQAKQTNQWVQDRFNPPGKRELASRQMRLAESTETNRTANDQARIGIDRQRLNVDEGRYGAQQRLAEQRLGLDSTTAAADVAYKGAQTQGAVQILAAQRALAAAKTPEQRNAAAETLRQLQGKDRQFPNRYTVVPGGQEVDPATQLAVTRPARVLDNQTGQFVDQPAGAAPKRAAPVAGAVEGGYRFKGGDPANQANWEKVR